MSTPTGDPQDELRDVDEELYELRMTATELRAQVGERSDGPTDSSENASVITAAEEQEALIDALESRRSRLLQRLGQT